ncbi:hypothetical protein SS50377_24838 [Spironucleus salmonicida]|uniref:Uncharacterized protein n=1 Tax=Spironucleus salmonicida TaxID=348837 RepID=A0A9P8LQZ7_9EUKA|nr:hypothetical protein SS50377_24838 [Spironucleus salmonicida]
MIQCKILIVHLYQKCLEVLSLVNLKSLRSRLLMNLIRIKINQKIRILDYLKVRRANYDTTIDQDSDD